MSLTVADIEAAVADVFDHRDDAEEAHTREDELLVRVLTAIAKDEDVNPSELAAAALKVCDLPIRRYYA